MMNNILGVYFHVRPSGIIMINSDLLGKIESRRRSGQQRMRWLDGITDSINGHGSEQTPGDGEEQGSLVCCSPWGHKESDMTKQLNNNGVHM